MWLTILVVGIYIALLIATVINQKKIRSAIGNKLIEIDTDEIRIISKTRQDIEIISLDDVEKIIVKDEYAIPQDSIKDISLELAGNTRQNYIIVTRDAKKKQLDFEIDTHYMISQLTKLIDCWREKGYNVESISS